jgi:hypothetical protein
MYYGNINTVSNRADWQEVIELTDDDTGDPIDISGCRITLSVVKLPRDPNFYMRDGYYGFPAGYATGLMLTGSTDTGEITLPDVGTFQWLFPYTRMACLSQGNYQIGIRISQDDRVMQLFVGTVKVDEGFDTQ